MREVFLYLGIPLFEQRRIVAYLDNVQARLASLPALHLPQRFVSGCTSGRLQSQTQEELPPSLRFGGATQDALSLSPSAASGIPSILDKAFKAELC